MTTPQQGPVSPGDSWPRIGWLSLVTTVVVSGFLGFVVLSRYQQNGPALDTWRAICTSLGLISESPASQPTPPLRPSSRLAWTPATLARIRDGDPRHGAIVSVDCKACHGASGISNAGLMPTIAGMSAEVIYKQLNDFAQGLRPWNDMSMIGSLLSDRDKADVAAYWAGQPGLPKHSEERVPASGHSLRQNDPAVRLVYAGDPERGIAPCSACHGPEGLKLGAPALEGQQAAYIEHQLVDFAASIRRNDIDAQMRTIARELSAGERRSLAAFYSGSAMVEALHQVQSAP